MTAIWRNNGSGWSLLVPTGFPDEATLHALVEQTPQILPLAGDPQLVVVGKEVLLGNGYADLIAVEPSGRLVIIEVKLARNAESKRAVIAQILTYAAYLRGLNAGALQKNVLRRHLNERGYETLSDAVIDKASEDIFDPDTFGEGLANSLAQGRFRLVIVLDEAPEELVRLVGYLEVVAEGLLIDLVVVPAYKVDESKILVPQRVDTEQRNVDDPTLPSSPRTQSRRVEGAEDFVANIQEAPQEDRMVLRGLCDWALSLEHEGLARLRTTHGKGRWVLVPRLLDEDVALAKIWNERGAYLQLSRTVFERRAPESLPIVEEILAPTPVGQGNVTREISNGLLEALTDAYREAASGKVSG